MKLGATVASLLSVTRGLDLATMMMMQSPLIQNQSELGGSNGSPFSPFIMHQLLTEESGSFKVQT